MKKHGAFSLVELSIVLVILGLLVGGILAGQSLIRASELRSVGADITRYQAAVHAFRDKYFALPGDMANAVRFWGAQAGSTADGPDSACRALTTAASGLPTCNGNGNGVIGNTQTTTEHYERYRFWQHLANAGLVEGQLSGVVMTGAGYSSRSAIPGTNIPASRLDGVGYGIRYDGTTPDRGNALVVGKANNFWGAYFENSMPGFRNEDVWNIDTKMDDGLPNTGKYIANSYDPGFSTCQTSGAAAAGYNLAQSGINCAFTVINYF